MHTLTGNDATTLTLNDRQHHVVRGAGHMINMEQPGTVNELLASFLAQLTEDQRCHR
jgi:pimeloyl-ACP methyl ester carboxylesterase